MTNKKKNKKKKSSSLIPIKLNNKELMIKINFEKIGEEIKKILTTLFEDKRTYKTSSKRKKNKTKTCL